MKQNVRDSEIRYQEFLILAYFRANYKKYEFSEVSQMMGMTYIEMQNSIEHLLKLEYLIFEKNNIIISKKGEKVLEKKGLSNFFCNHKKEIVKKEQLGIDEPYIPIKFKL